LQIGGFGVLCSVVLPPHVTGFLFDEAVTIANRSRVVALRSKVLWQKKPPVPKFSALDAYHHVRCSDDVSNAMLSSLLPYFSNRNKTKMRQTSEH